MSSKSKLTKQISTQVELLAKLSKKSGLSPEEISYLFINQKLQKLFPAKYESLTLRVIPNPYIVKAAKALKVSQGDIIATLFVSYAKRQGII